MDVPQQRAAGVARVGHVKPAAAQAPNEPGIDRAKEDFALGGLPAEPVARVQQVLDLRAGEIWVHEQAGLLAEDGLAAVGLQALADRGAQAALPDHGVGDRPAGVAVPEDGCFALVGHAEGGEVRGGKPRGGHRPAGHAKLARPDRLRVMLDQAGAGQDLLELLLGLGDWPAVAAHDDRPAGGRALVECENELFHFIVTPAGSPRRVRSAGSGAGPDRTRSCAATGSCRRGDSASRRRCPAPTPP